MKKVCIMLAAAFIAVPSFVSAADGQGHKGKESAVKNEIRNHFKFYGFIRNYFAVDTRESVAGTGDLFYYMPKDVSMNEDGSQDLNAQASFRFLSLTSRLGVDVTGYQVGRTKFGAKVETDFYAGLTNKINGTAQLRLRQAYMTIGWDNLSMANDGKAAVALKIGQAWHPMAADMPHVFSLETGAPFNAFSRTPLVLMDASLGKNIILTAGAIWQMQYLSQGPAGASAEYIKYAGTPEGYVGVTLKSNDGFLARVGASVLSIKPRRTGKNSDDVTVKVSDRITTVNPYIYLQYKYKTFEVKAKSIYSQSGEHMSLMGGYGVSNNSFDDGHWEYTPLQASSTWASLSYGKKWQVTLFGGYMKNLGSVKELVNVDGVANAKDFYYNANGSKNLNSLWRIIPAITYNVGKFSLGLEYNYTAAQYGDGESYNAYGLSTEGLHWVGNHRIQMMVKFTF
ncbi:MAG: hypothetical protein NC308_09110 [Clostridium sp.]|nr:hypothetical protein [Bacteroides sp.]MCM1199034.1 hypothetical protein [Clostridium sp.]